MAVETSGFVTPPAHAAFRELAAEQTRREMIPSARGMVFPYKVGYAVRLRRILERVAVAILRAKRAPDPHVYARLRLQGRVR